MAKSSEVAPHRSMRRRAASAKNAGFVAPRRWNRSQSGSSRRSPPTGAKNPLGVVSAPTTSATSQNPARMLARAVCSACAPEAHAAYDDDTGTPVHPSFWANVDPATNPG
jgi:hypothetical protein